MQIAVLARLLLEERLLRCRSRLDKRIREYLFYRSCFGFRPWQRNNASSCLEGDLSRGSQQRTYRGQ